MVSPCASSEFRGLARSPGRRLQGTACRQAGDHRHDEEVEQALTSVREQHATYSTVEGRALAEGDFAQASMDGKPKDGKDVEAPAPILCTWMTC